MAEIKSTFTVGVANEGERNMSVEDLLRHEPKKVTYGGTQVFFEHDGTFLSMTRLEYQEVFGKYK